MENNKIQEKWSLHVLEYLMANKKMTETNKKNIKNDKIINCWKKNILGQSRHAIGPTKVLAVERWKAPR